MTSRRCNLIILGAPGAGKGTQAQVVSKQLGVPHVDCGRVVRSEVAEKTEFGAKAEGYMVQGKLVPDDLMIGIVLKRLNRPDYKDGFLLDGFPRTLDQAVKLDEFLDDSASRLDYVISLGISEETAVRRLSSRRVCPVDGRVYNLLTAPPGNEDTCDVCQNKLVQRPDDMPGTIIERLKVYHEETAPLIEYYKSGDGFLDIDGGGETDVVSESIMSAIRERGRCGI